jgi:deoxyribodipyrimidine photo-lyase
LEKERLQELNSKDIARGSYVLYWMMRSKRVADNPALAYAVEQANEMQLPLIALYVLTDGFPDSNLSHYHFVWEGMPHIAAELSKLNVSFFSVLGNMTETVSRWAEKAALVVADTGYLRYQIAWKTLIAHKSPCRMVQLEGNCLFPVNAVMNKEAYNAKVLRDKIHRLLPEFELQLFDPGYVKTTLPAEMKTALEVQTEKNGEFIVDHASVAMIYQDRLRDFIDKQDSSVKQRHQFRGGYPEASKYLKTFVEELLPGYQTNRGNPAVDYQSNLSPYLHFGQISIRQALQSLISSLDMPEREFFKTVVTVKPGKHWDDRVNGALEFFEEAVVRRELGANFCCFNEDYDQYSALPEWARQTLREHVSDPRPYLYELPALENAETHDACWNAAQKEMVLTGKMHGYMRMYWCKKIIEWCREPEEAFQISLYLNNKYELDGRDPNGFAGVAWCFGKHDRAWGTFPVFGNVRIMKESGLYRKFDMKQYIARIDQL